jgi:TonB family protein
MFALIESCPGQRAGFGWSGKLASLVIHSVLISAALVLTHGVVTGSPYRPPIIDIGPPAPIRPVAPTAPTTGGTPPAPSIALPIPLVPPTIIAPDLPAPLVGALTPPGTGDTLVIGTHTGGNPVLLAPDAPRDVHVVDGLPVLLSHPPIRYPDAMRQAGLEGRVLVETVLDSLGRAEPGATRVSLSASEPFDREAVAVVLGSRYRAARMGGHAVRVRVVVPVNFTIR